MGVRWGGVLMSHIRGEAGMMSQMGGLTPHKFGRLLGNVQICLKGYCQALFEISDFDPNMGVRGGYDVPHQRGV